MLKGPGQLTEWLAATGVAREVLADAVGVDAKTIREWQFGASTPTLRQALTLDEITYNSPGLRIPPGSWVFADVLAFDVKRGLRLLGFQG
jgi:transcriptional regulator with XRE-family HTH domain